MESLASALVTAGVAVVITIVILVAVRRLVPLDVLTDVTSDSFQALDESLQRMRAR